MENKGQLQHITCSNSSLFPQAASLVAFVALCYIVLLHVLFLYFLQMICHCGFWFTSLATFHLSIEPPGQPKFKNP